MKRAAITAIVLLLPMMLCAASEEAKDGIEALLETVDLSEWDDWFREECGEVGILPSDFLKELSETNGSAGSGSSIETLASVLLPSLKSAALLALLLLGLAILGAALNGAAEASAIGETAQSAFRIAVSGAVLVTAFAEVRAALRMLNAVDKAAEILLPALIGFLTLSDMTNTAALLPVSHAMLSETVLKLVKNTVVPLAVLSGVLSAADAGGAGRLAAVGRLLQRAAKWILGTACALFLIVTAVRSTAAVSADSVLVKTTKLAAGSIPSVGALLSESVETGYQCIRFVRSILGLTGCVLLLSTAAKPVLSIAATRCAVRASALLSEPLSGKPYAELLRGIGDMLHILMLCELAAEASALLVIAPVFGGGGAP